MATGQQPSGPGATGGLPGTGSDTPDGTGFADGSTIGSDEAADTVSDADVAPVDDTAEQRSGDGGGLADEVMGTPLVEQETERES